MAIKISTTYSGRTDNTDPNYPYGKGRNVVGGVEGTGTPFEADWYNNLEGFLQGLLLEAGVTPDGDVDNANSSQLVEAVKGLIVKSLWGDRFVGYFSEGFTYTSPDDVAKGVDGNYYGYIGGNEYPVVVSGGYIPNDTEFKKVTAAYLESRKQGLINVAVEVAVPTHIVKFSETVRVGPPTLRPHIVGATFFDYTGKVFYDATGTLSSADWRERT